MTKYIEFSISLKPDEIDQFAQEANKKTIANEENFDPEKIYDNIKFATLSESLNLFQQHKIYSDQEIRKNIATQAEKLDKTKSIGSIYTKAFLYDGTKENRDKIAEDYKANSIKDTGDRLPSITIKLDNKKPITITIPEGNRENWDQASNYLENEYKVKISDEQRNFLRSQLNQSGILGTFNSILAPNLPLEAGGAPTENLLEFHFTKDKLNKISSTTKTKEEKEGYSHITEIDVSNLTSDANSKRISDPDIIDYMPKYSAKEIKMSFKSNDSLEVDILPEMDKLLKKHAKLEGKEAIRSVEPNIFTKIKNYISTVYNDLKSTFNSIKESIKNTLTQKQTQDTPKVERNQENNEIQENKSRGRIPPKNAERNFNNMNNYRFNSVQSNSKQKSSNGMNR